MRSSAPYVVRYQSIVANGPPVPNTQATKAAEETIACVLARGNPGRRVCRRTQGGVIANPTANEIHSRVALGTSAAPRMIPSAAIHAATTSAGMYLTTLSA